MDETSVVSTETPTAVLARRFSTVGQARPPQEYRIKEIRDDSLFTDNDVFNHVHAEIMRRDCLELVVGDRTALGSAGAIDIEFDLIGFVATIAHVNGNRRVRSFSRCP